MSRSRNREPKGTIPGPGEAGTRSRSDGEGVLYVVATPIGNLEDLSPRAIRILREVDRVAAEDTRSTGRLFARHDVHTLLTSYHDAVEAKKAPGLVAELLAGSSIALVSEAGTPLVSDPGYRLVAAAVEAGIRVIPIPGPSAVTALLSVAGLPTDRFVFEGFLPPKPGKRKKRLEALREEERTIVLYESPHRIVRTLVAVEEILGDRRIAVGRELTKMFEEVLRGRVSQVCAGFEKKAPRGELTIAIAGADVS